MKTNHYDLIVIGSGAAGIMASVTAASEGKKVLLLEKLSNIATKLKATGGGKCNLTNTLSNEEFISRFGRGGRFMRDALSLFDNKQLTSFMNQIGVATHAPDGFRIFPTSHSSSTIISGLQKEMDRVGVEVITNQRVERLLLVGSNIDGVKTQDNSYKAKNVIVATGGLGYPVLGAEGDGYTLAEELGHKITELSPAMMPLKTKEIWTECRADTISKVELRVSLPKYKKLRAKGDLIFTKNGIRGPVVLDFAREITPLLSKYGEVPIVANLTKGMNEDDILQHFKQARVKNPHATIEANLLPLLASSVIHKLCQSVCVDPSMTFHKVEGKNRNLLIKVLASTPFTITGHEGFKMAMITRGGISLKKINPKTMQSKIIKGLYFCGEVMDIDGPCGGFNLQWSFASGYLSGKLLP